MINNQVFKSEKFRLGALVFGAALGGFAGFSCVFFATLGVIMPSVLAEYQIGRPELAWLADTMMFGFALACPIAGLLMDRFGIRRVIFISAVALASLMVLLANFSGGLSYLFTLTFLIGFLGAPTTALGYVTVLPQWFDRRLGQAIAFATLGYGLGMMLMPVLAQYMVANFGWRYTYEVFGVASLVLALLALSLIRENKQITLVNAAVQARPCEEVSIGEAFRSGKFWLMIIVFFVVACAVASMPPMLPGILRDKGFDTLFSARGASSVGIGFFTARIVAGFAMDRIHARFVASFAFLAAACGIYLISQASSQALILCGAFAMGVATGTEQDLIAFMTRRYFGVRSYKKLYGIGFASFSFGAVAGPIFFQSLHNNLGSVNQALMVLVILLTASGLAVLGMGRYPNNATEKIGNEPQAILQPRNA